MARQRRGYPLIPLGILLGIFTRPDEFALLVGAFAVAMVFRPRSTRRAVAGRRVGSIVFLGLILGVTGGLTVKLIHDTHAGVGQVLSLTNKNNASVPTGVSGSNVPYSSDPLTYPRDVYTVLFDPLPITAGSLTQGIASLENTVILIFVLASLRRLKLVFRAGRERPYVILCAVYSVAFIYAFAALGNLGLITRERTLLIPYLLVLLALPVSAKGEPPQYPWERARVSRSERRLAKARMAEFPTGGVDPWA
jgi:hypothetical protein